jgi:hypothetical protein
LLSFKVGLASVLLQGTVCDAKDNDVGGIWFGAKADNLIMQGSMFFASRNSPLLQNIFPGATGEN